MNPKSQENDRRNHGFLQIPLLQINKTPRRANVTRVLHSELFKTADGAINIAVAGNAIWQRFANAVGKPEWAESEGYRDNPGRLARRDQLNTEIETITVTRTSREWIDMLAAKGVPCGEIYGIDEMFDDPQVRHLGIATAADTVPFGQTRLVGQPVELARTPSKITQPPPERGQHTGEILRDLGYSDSEIAELRNRQII